MEELAKHKEARAYYDMTGTKNVYRYITTEGKRAGTGANALDYLRKNTGVFNGNGMISAEEVEAMKTRARDGEKNLWHGFISLSEDESHKIDTPEKCIALIKSTFNSFLKDAKFNPDNIDLMCALHLDRPNHLHLHFLFWEKAPKYKGKDNALHYRRRGKIENASLRAVCRKSKRRSPASGKGKINPNRKRRKITNIEQENCSHFIPDTQERALNALNNLIT